MTDVLFATSNRGKVRELAALFEGIATIVGLGDLPIDPVVVEDGETFEANARKKASVLAARAERFALADDSGLEVDALHGAPGVYSARYAHPEATDAENIAALVRALDGRTGPLAARFRCVLVFAAKDGQVLHVEHGVCEGTITTTPRGDGGFGYDPVFVPSGETRTMAEMTPGEKASLSHRGIASRAMRTWMEGFFRGG